MPTQIDSLWLVRVGVVVLKGISLPESETVGGGLEGGTEGVNEVPVNAEQRAAGKRLQKADLQTEREAVGVRCRRAGLGGQQATTWHGPWG